MKNHYTLEKDERNEEKEVVFPFKKRTGQLKFYCKLVHADR